MKLKICFISDTHSLHNSITNKIPECDILIHSGDLTNCGELFDVLSFSDWLKSLNQVKNKVIIAGNHDFCFEVEPAIENQKLHCVKILEKDINCKYLKDKFIEIQGVKIYGSPWQPEFGNWAFNLPRNGKELEDKWNEIPTDIDILITHGPPKGILDLTLRDYYNAGCEKLLDRIKVLCPPIHCFGHIHEGYGVHEDAVLGTTFINASICTLHYKPINEPILIEYDIKEKNVIVLK